MKPQIFFIIAVQILFSIVSARAEEKVMLLSGNEDTNTLRLEEGESAELVYAFNKESSEANSTSIRLTITKGDKAFSVSGNANNNGLLSPVTITGPAAIKLEHNGIQYGYHPNVATFSVTRVGTASNPSAIPLEAGSNFQVILESSSDLVNWTPANPGEYSGTEAKRFFRTRIVKK